MLNIKDKKVSGSKRHHYIPVFLQKGFLVDERNVLVFDKKTGESFKTTPVNVFVKENFNSIYGQSFEPAYTRVDSLVAPIINRIRKSKDINIPYDEHGVLCLFVSMMMFRTKSTRDSIQGFNDWIAKTFTAYTKQEASLPLEWAKQSHLNLSLPSEDLAKLAELVWDKKLMLIETTPNFLILGDHAITTFNDRFYDFGMPKLGVGCEGIRIHFPISNSLCLIFRDPNISGNTADAGTQPSLINKLQFETASRFVLVQNDPLGGSLNKAHPAPNKCTP
jgi:hypothetical protein